MSTGETALQTGRTTSATEASALRPSVWVRRSRELDRYDGLIMAALFAVYLLVQLEFVLRPVPITGGDQLDYFSTAGDIQETRITHRHLRIGLTLPVRLLIDTFGYSEVAYYAVPMAAGLLFVAATYLLGALLHSRAAGAIGAVAAAINAYVLRDSSHLLPDLLAAGLLTMALVMIGGSTDRGQRRFNGALFGAGLLIGWAYLTREYTIVFAPLAALAAWTAGRTKLLELAQVAAGALAMLCVELVHGTLLFGDPFAHIRRVVSFKGPSLSTPAPAIAGQDGYTLVDAFSILPGRLLQVVEGGWLFILLTAGLALGLVLAVALRRPAAAKRLLLPLVWVLMIYALLSLASWSTNGRGGSVINISKVRYWFPIFPGLAVGGAIGLLSPFDGEGVNRWVRHGVALVLTTFAALGAWASVDSIDESRLFVANGAGSEFREFRDWISTDGASVTELHVDSDYGRALDRVLPMFTRTAFGRPLWSGEIERLVVSEPTAVNDLDGPVAVHRRSTDWLAGKEQMPTYLAQLPSEWTPMFISSNGLLAVFEVAPSSGDTAEVTAATDAVDSAAAAVDANGWELALGNGEEVLLPYLVDPAPGEQAITIELDDTVTGGGSVSILCDYEVAADESAFSVTPEAGDPAAEVWFCHGPDLARIEIHLVGPLKGNLTAVTATTAPSD